MAAAKPHFERLTATDCNQFCVLLTIKAVESYYFLAKMAIIDGDTPAAIYQLQAGKQVISGATRAFQASLDQHEDEVATFLWPEMADMLDAGALLNNLLIKIRTANTTEEVLLEARFLENNKRFGLINLVDSFKQTFKDDDTQQLKLIGQSYVNRLVAKVCTQPTEGDLYIWGTGVVAKNAYVKLQEKRIRVAGFIDNNAESGAQFLGLPVLTPSPSLFATARTVCITSVGSSAEIASSVPNHVQCIYIA